MSKGDWLRDIAVGLIVLAMALGAAFGVLAIGELGNHPHEDRSGQPGAQQHSEAAQSEAAPRLPPSRVIQSAPANPNPGRQEYREEEDLEAQQAMARWALWMLVATSTGVVVTLVGVIFVARTLHHTAEQSKAAVEQAEITRRQFLYSKKPVLRIEIVSENLDEAMDAESHFVWGTVKFAVTNEAGVGAAFFLQDCRLELGLREETPAPEEASFQRYYTNDFGEVLPAGGRWEGEHSALDLFTPDLARRVWGQEVKICFFGLIRYRDENWNHWETGFCAEWLRFAEPHLWAFRFYNSAPYRFDRPAEEQD